MLPNSISIFGHIQLGGRGGGGLVGFTQQWAVKMNIYMYFKEILYAKKYKLINIFLLTHFQ